MGQGREEIHIELSMTTLYTEITCKAEWNMGE